MNKHVTVYKRPCLIQKLLIYTRDLRKMKPVASSKLKPGPKMAFFSLGTARGIRWRLRTWQVPKKRISQF